MQKRAFSLIELMVVIAIVAFIASLAVPAYNRYVIKTKAAKAALVIDGLVDKAIKFATVNGRYANAYELGLSSL